MDFDYEDDIWVIREMDEKSQHYKKAFRFRFDFIEQPVIRGVYKKYVSAMLQSQKNTTSKLYTDLRNFKYFVRFAAENGIEDLSSLDNDMAERFVAHLKSVRKRNGEPLSYKYQKKVLDGLKCLIAWCRIYSPEDVPANEIFAGNEFSGTNRRLLIEFIPDDVVAQINDALVYEKNIYVKYGIIIMETTGIRKGDLFLLETGCVEPHPINGHMMSWFEHKTGKYHAKIPVPPECAEAVRKLKEETDEYRDRAPEELKKYLFLHPYRRVGADEYGNISLVRESSFNQWLNEFVIRNEIKDQSGEIYHLTPHQFRRTLGTDMFSKGISINVIQEVLGHSSPGTTRSFYADVKDQERAEVMARVGVIGNIDKISRNHFGNVADFEWFKENKNTGACLCDGYCTSPVVDGKVCDRLLRRQKCYTCSRYITTPEYLDEHKMHLERLEKQVEAGKIYGEHYEGHFRGTINVLRQIIKELEKLKNDKR